MLRKIIFRMGGALAATVCLALALLAGCKGSEKGSDTPVTVTVESSGIVAVADGASAEVDFTVAPASTDFAYDSGRYNARLCYAVNHTATREVYLESVKPAGEGRYTARIVNRNISDKPFRIDVRIFITTADGRTYMSGVFCVQNTEATTGISSIGFLRSDNPQLDEDLYCTYDEATSTFSARTPEVIDLSGMVATFIASGRVTVGGVEQQSGSTPNDFGRDVKYVVESGGERYEYTVRLTNFTGLPVVYINSSTGLRPIGNDITSKEEWKAATIRIDGNGVWDDLPETPMSLRGRGNITWGWDKKPFNMKFEKRTSMLGMPEHKRWVMLANYCDRTMLRNSTAFYASGLTSLEWAPRSQYVELFYNGDYTGTYQLTEQVRVDENRVNVHELQPDDADITGGYLVEFDFHWDESPRKWSPRVPSKYGVDASWYIVKSPDDDDLTDAQFDYIRGYIDDFERTIMDDALRSDPDKGYRKYIEPLSFIDYWLLYEVCINHEIVNPGSVYLHKDRGGKLVAGPIWDFDYGTFNFDYHEAKPAAYSLYVKDAIWMRYLFKDEAMKALAKQRWEELRPKFLQLPDFIDGCAARLRYAAEENFARWPMTVTDNGDAYYSYDQAIVRIKEVINRRIAIIDECMASW